MLFQFIMIECWPRWGDLSDSSLKLRINHVAGHNNSIGIEVVGMPLHANWWVFLWRKTR